MDFSEIIKNNFNKGFFNKAMQIEGLPEKYPAWTIKHSEWVGVAIPVNEALLFNESFADMKIFTTDDIIINRVSRHLLIITCSDMNLRDEFSLVCSNFIDPGDEGKYREILIENPECWWSKWRSLLGNVIENKEPYSVLGEMISAEWLLNQGILVDWSGIKNGTQDLETENAIYEVKSTITKRKQEVTINSIFQLDNHGKKLYLIFCRFEESYVGRSIEDLVQSLVAKNYSAQELEKYLGRNGFEKGSTIRNRKFKLLEMKLFEINDQFPAITEHSFKKDKLPENIVGFTYTIDLAGVQCENIL